MLYKVELKSIVEDYEIIELSIYFHLSYLRYLLIKTVTFNSNYGETVSER